jgi:phage terminase large subunit-like protein
MINNFQSNMLTKRDLLLFDESICKNDYILYNPYPKQSWPIFEANKPLVDNEANQLLVGAGGYGGKTWLGTMLASQYLDVPGYSCLVTRLNYAELTGEDSIWENLKDWACDEERLGDLACVANESKLRITSPFGAKVWFKAFDNIKKKGKVKSESYDRIINDEASELDPNVLTFLFRSLRNALDARISIAMINLSNPGGPSTEYLRETYVDGNKPYFPLDWRHNPFINKVVYSKTLDNLTFMDRKYQKDGDWHYTPQSGDIFDAEMIDNATINMKQYNEILKENELLMMVRGWDIAATDKKQNDYTASTLLMVFKNDLGVVTRQESFKKLPGHLEKRMKLTMTVDGLEVEQWIEHQPAAAGDIVDYHWLNEFDDYNVTMVPVFKNKVIRAGRLVPRINEEKLLFLDDPKTPYLDIFTKQAINFPNFDKIKEDDEETKHDDRIDSLSLIINKLHPIKDKKDRVKFNPTLRSKA